jgi:Tfp pilus assembly protein PilF
MISHQDRYDEAMFDYCRGDFQSAAVKLRAILAEDPAHLDSQLSLAMCCYRLGENDVAIAEGHKAERLDPTDQLVHTNLSLFYIKAGNKQKAEHHVAQARMASWRQTLATAKTGDEPVSPPRPPPKPEA